ncbi:hypothetical protein QTG54_013131 [Skeletonema marinoi]|uniref:Uncharacterized protein n=1 Tax=Skeletonema marinoi TaxID=267567 RepID=A0AAD8XZ24_9STRA|nr:hypothetical protein QTG54_013131 [Skeletonema marinoi]
MVQYACCSFMFWCDIVGTLTFIYDLSYINVLRAIPMSIGLEVKDGISILVVIGRTARLARPIRSHVLVEGMHFYVTRNAKLLYLNPSFWLRKLASLQNYRSKSSRNETSLAHASERVLVGSAATNTGNMFSLGDTMRGSDLRNSMVRVTEEQDSEYQPRGRKSAFVSHARKISSLKK